MSECVWVTSLHILTCCIGPPFLASEASLDTSPQPLRSQLYPYESSYGGRGGGVSSQTIQMHTPRVGVSYFMQCVL